MPRRPKKPIVTVAEAAAAVRTTPQTIYNWIKRGHFPARRDKRGHYRLRYADVEKYVAKLNHEYREWERIRAGRLTDEEWLQRMWDNDPD